MKYITLGLLALLVSGCTDGTPSVPGTTTAVQTSSTAGAVTLAPASKSPVFDARKADIGDIVAGLSVRELDVQQDGDASYFAMVRFDGELRVTGTLVFTEELGEGWGLGNYFEPDDQSAKSIPVLNTDPARNGFTIVDNEQRELKDLRLAGQTFKVELRVKEYEIWSAGKGQENKAALVEIIQSSAES